MEKKPNRKTRKIRLTVKIFLCLIYIGTIFILVSSGFRLYTKDIETVKWKDVKSTKEYSYIKVSQMSEAFAVIGNDKQVHFVMEKEDNGNWHTYLVAIKKSDYEKYKNMIDYTYERIKDKPDDIIIYGYPREITDNIRDLAIKNITNFVPIENKVVLTKKNFEDYLTNTYLDSTLKKSHATNYIVVTLLLLALIIFVLTIFTLFDRDKIVDEASELIEKELEEVEEKMHKEKEKKENNNDDEIELLEDDDDDIEIL